MVKHTILASHEYRCVDCHVVFSSLENIPDDCDAERRHIREHINAVLSERHLHLEKYAAAFLKQVGSERALDYELVEQCSPDWKTTKWFFQERNR